MPTTKPSGPCLVCHQQPGHDPTCALAVPAATCYLTEPLKGGTSRAWAVSGIKYTGTDHRRHQVRQAISTMLWVRAGGDEGGRRGPAPARARVGHRRERVGQAGYPGPAPARPGRCWAPWQE